MNNLAMISLIALPGIFLCVQQKSVADSPKYSYTTLKNGSDFSGGTNKQPGCFVNKTAQKPPDQNNDVQCKGKPDFSACMLSGALNNYNICIGEKCVMPGCGSVECNTPGPHFRIGKDTGSGHNRSLSAISDEPVVTDALTGLVWQGCAAGLSGSACTKGQAVKTTWWEALNYCNSLHWGEVAGWRLPDAHELLSIVDYGRAEPATDVTIFQNTPSSSWFWSSTSRKNVVDSAWSVLFGFGNLNFYHKTYNFNVRCVREEKHEKPAPPAVKEKINERYAYATHAFIQRFDRIFPGSGNEPVVRDNVTGLFWQGCPAGFSGKDCHTGNAIRKTWDEAQLYCERLNWGGRSKGWRMPSVRELSSLIDYRRQDPATDTSVFNNTSGDFYWSLTPFIRPFINNDCSWFVGFNYGIVSYLTKRNNGFIRCVSGEI